MERIKSRKEEFELNGVPVRSVKDETGIGSDVLLSKELQPDRCVRALRSPHHRAGHDDNTARIP